MPPPYMRAPPFALGITTSWIYTQNQGINVVEAALDDGDAPLVALQVEVRDNGEVSITIPVCDAAFYGLPANSSCGAVINPGVKGFFDLDKPPEDFWEPRRTWLASVVQKGTPSKVGEGVHGAMLTDVAWRAFRKNMLPAVATGYLQPPVGRLVTAIIAKVTGLVKIDEETVEASCPLIPSPSALVHRVSYRAVAATIAGAVGGMGVGWLRSRSARERNAEIEYALRQLSLLGHEKPTHVERRLAMKASRALIPARVVDQGALAVVRWVRSKRPSHWKRLRALGTVALLSAAVGSRQAGAAAITAAATDAAMAEPDLIGAPEADLLEARELNGQAKDKVIRAVLGVPLKRLETLSQPQIRTLVLSRFPNALEVLFSQLTTGKPYAKKQLIQRVMKFPQLLRRSPKR